MLLMWSNINCSLSCRDLFRDLRHLRFATGAVRNCFLFLEIGNFYYKHIKQYRKHMNFFWVKNITQKKLGFLKSTTNFSSIRNNLTIFFLKTNSKTVFFLYTHRMIVQRRQRDAKQNFKWNFLFQSGKKLKNKKIVKITPSIIFQFLFKPIIFFSL